MIATKHIYGVAILALAFIYTWSWTFAYAPQRELWLIERSGQMALLSLLLTLTSSPAAKILGRQGVKTSRPLNLSVLQRALGLSTAGFAFFHAWTVYSSGFIPTLSALITEPQWRDGLAALVILFLLALSSFPRVVRATRIEHWKSLHRMVYGALVFAMLHLFISPDLESLELIFFGGLVAAVFILRSFSAKKV